MLKKVGFILLALILVFLGFVARQPSDYFISRNILINAPIEKIFPYLNNSKLAEKWGPWLEIDPDAKMTYSGPESGVGSKASWDHGKKLGTGSATIVESNFNRRVAIKLEYTRPMSMTQDAEYIVETVEKQSLVTWRVRGKNTFFGRIMCMFGNMDKMVGGMFERGLLNLKNLVEKQG